MALTGVQERPAFGATARRDLWWIQPLAVFLGFSAFIVYSTWAAFQNAHYWLPGTNYLSPFYAPEIFGSSPHSWFGPQPNWWPSLMPFSPAFLILWAPGLFRFTCYYYRGAYYKAFWADPIACTVGEPRKGYLGERSFPLILQNVHRYFFYIAVLFIVMLSYDAWKAMWFPDPSGASGAEHFGIGLGTLVLVLNVILLGAYTFSCHSLRHLIGGSIDVLSGRPIRLKSWRCVSCLNAKHGNFAWFSLFSVGFADVYIRLCSMGIWHDWRIL
ncbi:MAG TPA: succinate dehydrogenase [Planctomycetota bacterium]|nr:succinate dehydrogenase [Planctomycetota bacterium]